MTLATMESGNVISMVSIGLNLLVTVAVFWIGLKQRKIDSMESEIKAYAEKSIDARIAILATEIRAALGQFNTVVGEIQKRLERGDDHFTTHDEAWHKLELKTQAQISEVRNWVVSNCATKDDLKDLAKAIASVNTQLARLETLGRLPAITKN